MRQIPEVPFDYESVTRTESLEGGMESAQSRTSRLLEGAGFRHAFFTRNGGVSTGAFASLNFSASAGDDPHRVEENIERAARSLGVVSERVLFCSQVHGRNVVRPGGEARRADVLLMEGDALIGRAATQAIGIRVADCLPILVADRRSGSVVAIHAGWKGLVCGVIRSGIVALRTEAGHDGELIAAIGPHIGTSRFEVSSDVAEQLANVSDGEPVVEQIAGEKPHVCLRGVARAQLRALGLAHDAIDDVPGCTHSEPLDWFSFRRDGPRSGRHLAAIVPRE